MIPLRRFATSQPAQVIGASGVAAAWSGAIGADQVSGRIITPSTALSSKASRFGRALCVSGVTSLNRAVMNCRQGADIPAAGDFTVAILFQFAQVTTGYASIGRWNTGGSAGTNDWFMGSSGTGGLVSGEMQFNVEVSTTTYSAADTFAGWNAARPYLMFGRRIGTTIGVYRYDYVAGTWRSGTTTNAGITTINGNSARALKLGELDTSATLNADVDMYGAYLFKRALSDTEFDAMAACFWRQFSPSRIWMPVTTGTTYNVDISEPATGTDVVSVLLEMQAALAETASSTDALAALAVFASDIAESAPSTDMIDATGAFGHTISESAIADDVVAGERTLQAVIAEAASADDVVSALAVFGAVIAEAVTASDVVVGLLAAIAAVTEAVTAVDTVNGSIGANTYEVEVTEAVTSSDAIAATAQLIATLAESAIADDAVSTAAVLLALLTESATPVDSVAAGALSFSVSINEVATALDVIVATVTGDVMGLTITPLGHGPTLSKRFAIQLSKRASNVNRRNR